MTQTIFYGNKPKMISQFNQSVITDEEDTTVTILYFIKKHLCVKMELNTYELGIFNF